MKILFVTHVPNQYIKDKDPLGIMCLSASLKQASHEVRICSPRISEVEEMLAALDLGLSFEELKERGWVWGSEEPPTGPNPPPSPLYLT